MDHFTFSGRESKLLEFKSTIPKFEALIKTCIAFANAAGGRIIIGVDDNSHKINELIKQKLIEKRGQGATTHYRLMKKH